MAAGSSFCHRREERILPPASGSSRLGRLLNTCSDDAHVDRVVKFYNMVIVKNRGVFFSR